MSYLWVELKASMMVKHLMYISSRCIEVEGITDRERRWGVGIRLKKVILDPPVNLKGNTFLK